MLSGRLALIVCPSPPSVEEARAAAYQAATARLKGIAAREPRLSVLSAADVASWYPVAEAFDPTADALGHVPYTEPMWCALGGAAARLARHVPGAATPPLKALVVDCDYTLWHHAVGEVGPAGVCGAAPPPAAGAALGAAPLPIIVV